MLFAKAALMLSGTLALATAYTFHEGVLRVDVDESRAHGGEHVHLWLPAAVAPMAMHLTPRRYLRRATENAAEWLPVARQAAKELAKYPDADLVDVRDSEETVHIRTSGGKLLIDVVGDEENVHVACPLAAIQDVMGQLEANAPTA